jgi:hypothetical protein
MKTNFFPLSSVAVFFIRDSGSGMGKNQGSRINIPYPQHCLTEERVQVPRVPAGALHGAGVRSAGPDPPPGPEGRVRAGPLRAAVPPGLAHPAAPCGTRAAPASLPGRLGPHPPPGQHAGGLVPPRRPGAGGRQGADREISPPSPRQSRQVNTYMNT